MASDHSPPSTEQALAQDAKARLEFVISGGEKLLANYFTEVQFAVWYADSAAIIEDLYGPNSSQLQTFDGNQPISVWIGAPDQEVQLEGTRKERLRNHLAALNSLVEQLGDDRRAERPAKKRKSWTGIFVRFIFAVAALQTIAFVAPKINPELFAGLAKFDEQLLASLGDLNPVRIFSFYYRGVSDVWELNQETPGETPPPDFRPGREPGWRREAWEQNVDEVWGGITNLFRQVSSRGWVGFLAIGSVGILTFALCLLMAFARQRTPKWWEYLLDIFICTVVFLVLYPSLGTIIWLSVGFLAGVIYGFAKIPAVAPIFFGMIIAAGWEILKHLAATPVVQRIRESFSSAANQPNHPPRD